MKDTFWLIQRGEFRNNLDSAISFLGGSNSNLIDLDYMGAAEFEWGAIPKAYRRIMGQFEKYSLHVTDLVTVGVVPFCLYCRNDRYEVILDAIKKYLNEPYQLKEWSNMCSHFTATPTDDFPMAKKHIKYERQTNFWWCIDRTDPDADVDHPYKNIVGDWIAFTGATDRQKAFNRVINFDYTSWWLRKSKEEREQEYKESFSRF